MNKSILYWLFIESHAKWLLMILTFEYFVAVNLSTTVLTDYPLLRNFVESLSFIPAIENFHQLASNPEPVTLYIALAFVLLIPKSISIYYFLVKNPITGMATYVITPYTKTKPASTSRMFVQMSQEEGKAQIVKQIPRSMFSRIFWSLLTLVLCIGFIATFLHYGWGSEASLVKKSDAAIANGGASMWYDLSVKALTFSGLFIAVSAFIIKDYCRLFFSVGKKLLSIFQ